MITLGALFTKPIKLFYMLNPIIIVAPQLSITGPYSEVEERLFAAFSKAFQKEPLPGIILMHEEDSALNQFLSNRFAVEKIMFSLGGDIVEHNLPTRMRKRLEKMIDGTNSYGVKPARLIFINAFPNQSSTQLDVYKKVAFENNISIHTFDLNFVKKIHESKNHS